MVKFIVRAVDDLLRRDFNLPNGLAETNAVTALDFAAGTGTFMLEMIRTVLADATPARRDLLAHGHILKNFYGFELLMAPYAIAHLKLSQFLADNDVPLRQNERINIFLTNTLEQISKQVELPMMPKLAEEANRAQQIKDSPVLVITGNPPYSGHSQNKGEWISNLLKTYKEVDGKPLGERNPKWLQDDYVKFIRFAQWKMERVEHGIVAIITNHSFLDNPTFRGMRQSLLNTFDTLYFLDLHGNTNKKEIAPDGGKDENVFDIQQGVAISLLVKNPKAKQKGVFHADLYGRRDDKYNACLESDLNTVSWKEIKPTSPYYLLISRDEKAAKRYDAFYSVQQIFTMHSVGIVTARDQLTLAFTGDEIRCRSKAFAEMPPEQARQHFDLGADARDWKIELAQNDLCRGALDDEKFCEIVYRPFDLRHTYYTGKSRGFHCMPRGEVMRHMLTGSNLGLLTSRITKDAFSCFCTNLIAAHKSAVRYDITYLFPLYRYDIEMGEAVRHENLSPEFRRWIDDRYGTAHPPENILGCIYAILHSPDYRNRYADFLRSDFPRIPFPADNAEFQRLATLGKRTHRRPPAARKLHRRPRPTRRHRHIPPGRKNPLRRKKPTPVFQPNRILRPRPPASFHLPNRRLPTPRQIPKIPQRPNLNPPRNRNPAKIRQRHRFYA